MNGFIKKTAASLSAVCLLVLTFSSCGPLQTYFDGMSVDSRTQAFDASAYGSAGGENLQERISRLIEAAVELGWPSPFVPKGILRGSGDGVGYLVNRTKDDISVETKVVWSEKDRDAYVAESKSKGYRAESAVLYHCRPRLDRRSPLPEAASKWNDVELGEWLVWEWAAERIGMDSREKLSAVSFAAWKFGEALITKIQGPGSLQLARWRETVWDRRTFQTLISDLREQVKGIIAANTDQAERDTTLRRIVKNWLYVYREQYRNRFITNYYQSFGNAGWVDPLVILGSDADTLGWKRWIDSVPEPLPDAGALLSVLK